MSLSERPFAVALGIAPMLPGEAVLQNLRDVRRRGRIAVDEIRMRRIVQHALEARADDASARTARARGRRCTSARRAPCPAAASPPARAIAARRAVGSALLACAFLSCQPVIPLLESACDHRRRTRPDCLPSARHVAFISRDRCRRTRVQMIG